MLVPGGALGAQELSVDRQTSENINNNTPLDLKQMTVKGTCQTLEKAFFRLTEAPDPTEVRPEEILQQTLKLMSKKWKKRLADYRYIDEQFRSMR